MRKRQALHIAQEKCVIRWRRRLNFAWTISRSRAGHIKSSRKVQVVQLQVFRHQKDMQQASYATASLLYLSPPSFEIVRDILISCENSRPPKKLFNVDKFPIKRYPSLANGAVISAAIGLQVSHTPSSVQALIHSQASLPECPSHQKQSAGWICAACEMQLEPFHRDGPCVWSPFEVPPSSTSAGRIRLTFNSK
jgi:hypothetical protein